MGGGGSAEIYILSLARRWTRRLPVIKGLLLHGEGSSSVSREGGGGRKGERQASLYIGT